MSGPESTKLLRRRLTRADGEKKEISPFSLPKDVDIFKQRGTDLVLKAQERKLLRNLPVHMKGTYLSRLRVRSATLRCCEEPKDDAEACQRSAGGAVVNIIQSSKGRSSHGQHSMRDFLTQQREMSMLQYSVHVEKETIKQLEMDIDKEYQRSHLAKNKLEEDSIAFEKFINEVNQNLVEAVNMAEKQTMIKLNTISEKKKVAAQTWAMRSDFSNHEDILKEYQTYRKFLVDVAPAEWRQEQEHKKKAAKLKSISRIPVPSAGKDEKKLAPGVHARHDSRDSKLLARHQNKQSGGIINRKVTAHPIAATPSETIPKVAETATETETDHDEEPELYYTDPRQLLDALVDLEEQNLSYIHNFQETEASYEIQKTIQLTQEKRRNEIQDIQQQIDILQNAIEREQETSSELVLKCKMFSHGEFRAEKQDEMLNCLHKMVKEAYKTCIGEVESDISTLDMLSNIELRVEEMLDTLETLPAERVETVKAVKDKEMRQKMREEKTLKQKLQQKERCKLAQERVMRDRKGKALRKMMPRSEPAKVKKNKVHRANTKELDDGLYFWGLPV